MTSVREEFIAKVEKEREAIFYKFPKTGKKFKFIIRPIISADFITKDITKEGLREMSNGQSIEEASRIAAEKFKERFQDMGQESAFKMLIEKGVIFPQIVDKKEDLKDDEIPFSFLDADMKNFIIKGLMKISPVFRG